MKHITVGVNDFVRRQIKGTGKTYSSLSYQEIAKYAEDEVSKNNFEKGYRDGVILIEIEKKLNKFFTSPLVKINRKTKLEQKENDIYIYEDKKINDEHNIVIKGIKEALLEKNIKIKCGEKHILKLKNIQHLKTSITAIKNEVVITY